MSTPPPAPPPPPAGGALGSTAAPPFSWSASRARLLARCERAYFLRYYAAHGGWRAPEGSESWLAYRLKHLTTLPAAVGTAVHRAAARCVRALSAGALPSYAALRAGAGAELNALWRAARTDARAGLPAFRRDPTGVAMFEEFVYADGPNATALERGRGTLDAALRALVGCGEVWDTVAAAAPEDVVLLDPFWHFALPPDGLTVFAAPDLLVRPAPSARWEVTDFKSGRPDGVADQLLAYAVAAREGLGLDVAAGVLGRVVALAGGPAERVGAAVISPAEIDGAVRDIRQSAAAMRMLLADPGRNRPLPAAAFRPCERAEVCRRCAFRALCHSDAYPTVLRPGLRPAARAPAWTVRA